MSAEAQTRTAVALGTAIIGAWAALHIYAVFFLPLRGVALMLAPAIILLICWLNVGLFIVAHDCMHGSFAPGRPALNRWVGRIALGLYAGFSFDRLRPKHFNHHKRPGTEHDPDFSTHHSRHFWPWYGSFLRQYFGMREFTILTALVAIYLLIGARMTNILLFWALPAIASSLQLFYFGTFLPHRHSDRLFVDEHRARSNDYGRLASLITCFHFGYHHEHHLSPHVPWWRLPGERAQTVSRVRPR